MQAIWIKEFKSGGLIDLDTVRLETITAQGVYVIYLAGNPPACVYVGKGDVAQRLASHRGDQRFEASRKRGALCVAFTNVPLAEQDGVEMYLATIHPPLIGERHPDVRAIAVNSPFAA